MILIVRVSIFLSEKCVYHECIVHTKMILHFLYQAAIEKNNKFPLYYLDALSNVVCTTF